MRDMRKTHRRAEMDTGAACRCRSLPAMAFVPVQELDCVYEPESGFRRGTLFPALDKPFLAGGCCK